MVNALKRTNGEGGLMIKWNEAVSETHSEEPLAPRHWELRLEAQTRKSIELSAGNLRLFPHANAIRYA